jgi:uncharacterized protein YqjF (DUF2071 family)
MAATIDRLSPCRRPTERPVGYQRWHHLLFLHWPVAADELARLVPSALTIDTFQDSAWLGIVCFTMSGVRPWWFPAVPGLSAFHETNVRTYVHHRGEKPGVWFLSLDAANSLAVRVARWRWKLNYFRSQMEVVHSGMRVRYASRRLWPAPAGAELQISAEVDGPAGEPAASGSVGHAVPGTLEHFLVERYLLYTQHGSGPLLTAQVHHAPYPLQQASVTECRQTLAAAAGLGLDASALPPHVLYSPGVEVEIFRLRPAVSR